MANVLGVIAQNRRVDRTIKLDAAFCILTSFSALTENRHRDAAKFSS